MWKVGDRLGRFRLDREIGQGSHGVVFAATDTALDTQVAVKILHPWLTQDTAVRDRFKRELLLARRIAHPGVCRLFDLHEEGEAFFITMEYVEGQTLLGILKNEGRLQPLRAVRILRGVCQALAAAHQAGVIHRDLKPANIIVRAGESPMILDFGTATAGDVSRVTRPGTAVGSMRFIAPEIFTGVSPSIITDVYSLGVVSYVVLAGKLPYNAAAGAIEMLELIRTQPPARLELVQPDIPRSLADVIGKAMAKAPEERLQSAKEFDAALALVEAEMTGASVRPTSDSAKSLSSPPPAADSFSLPNTGYDAPLRTVPGTPLAKGEATVVTEGDPAASGGEQEQLDAAFASAFGDAKAGSGGAGTEATKVAMVQALAAAAPEVPEADGRTVVDVPAPDLTLGSLPPVGATELPLVTGIVELGTKERREIEGDPQQVDDGGTAETPRPISIAAAAAPGDGAFEPRTGETNRGEPLDAPEAPTQESNAGVTLVIRNPLEEAARAEHEEAARSAGVASWSRFQASRLPPKGVLIAAAVGVVVLVLLITMLVGGDDPGDAHGTDAGALVAIGEEQADAGALADADAGLADGLDAGELVEADPGADGLDFADFDAGPDELSPDAKDPTIKRPKADPAVTAQIRSVRATMTKKGLIVGDLPKVDEILLRAHQAGMRKKRAEAERLITGAKAAVAAQQIDRALVLAKLGRFNSRYDRSKRPDIADKVEPLARAAAQAFSAGQYDTANQKLNQAFALLAKKK